MVARPHWYQWSDWEVVDSEYILKVNALGFADALLMCKMWKNKVSQEDPEVFGLTNWRMEWPLSGMGETVEEVALLVGNQGFGFRFLEVKIPIR